MRLCKYSILHQIFNLFIYLLILAWTNISILLKFLILFNELSSITIIIYFDARLFLDLASGSSFKLALMSF